MRKKDAGETPPSLTDAPWLKSPETSAVFRALAAGGHAARAVGGAVRNALLLEPVKDIDIATTALPGDVMRLAAKAGLKAVPTGLEHGTVTVVAGHVPFEVTTLRRDIETFGRHARVTFTTDWAEDARRRDFTINALYCDDRGVVHDPLGGYRDVLTRLVRFIGDPHDRIREDYLRILRFFRFTAQYSQDGPDPSGLAACGELKDGLEKLSGERIRAELLRLLAAKRSAQTVTVMHEMGIFSHALGQALGIATRPDVLARVAAIEEAQNSGTDGVLRLGALALSGPGAALALKERLKLSSLDYERLASMNIPDPALDPAQPEADAKAFIYRHGTQTFTDAAVLAWARSTDAPGDAGRRARLGLAQRFKAPELPVRGSDVIALGIPAGPLVGHILSAFEDWWIEAGFPSDPALLAAELKRCTMVTKS